MVVVVVVVPPLSECIAGFVSLLRCAVVIWGFVWFLSPPSLQPTRPPFFFLFLFPSIFLSFVRVEAIDIDPPLFD